VKKEDLYLEMHRYVQAPFCNAVVAESTVAAQKTLPPGFALLYLILSGV
jgi:hypothetical protein